MIKKKAPLKLVPVIQEVFTKLNIDACGPLPITSKGNRYLITAICMSSKFPEAIPVSDISSVSVTDALLNIFSRMGFPVKYNVTRSNPVERFHRTLKRLLRVLCLDAGSEWDKHLPSILLALRTVSHESTGILANTLSKTAQRYAAFCTSFGTYRPLRMSFGLKNAPYFFSKLMAELLNGLEDFVVLYLDDIAIFSDTWESHIKHMETVLQRIKRAKLTIKPSKCKFAQQNVKFLGHIVGQGFRTPSEIKVQAVLEFPTPRTKTQIRAFLGIAGYYQKYINLFSVIAAPLTDALKGRAKKGEIKWTTECENAFRELKGKLIDKPVLYAPNFEREFIVQTDASNAGMGAVLTQLTEQGEEHPILYLSKKFSEVEKRYCTTEKECASIVFAIKMLHYYLDGNSFFSYDRSQPVGVVE
ncbi:retrovirus-related Pol polyprotein from transposon 297 [Trichonephila clavipes]|uniref:RNA-directed DNA polymerase n=1 Tax=Trichonephila clavipes TaxID=2585209 RepID=A0A8X6RHS4_TRICX|nr:retrovirus-related Pol polyprotein from transposon 297 [Trichonephila clavipes]